MQHATGRRLALQRSDGLRAAARRGREARRWGGARGGAHHADHGQAAVFDLGEALLGELLGAQLLGEARRVPDCHGAARRRSEGMRSRRRGTKCRSAAEALVHVPHQIDA